MIAILVFAIVFGFWVDCQVCSLAGALSPCLMHSLQTLRTHTHAHIPPFCAQLVSTAVADAQLLSYKNGRNTLNMFHIFSNRFFLAARPASCRIDSVWAMMMMTATAATTTAKTAAMAATILPAASNNIISVPFHFILESFLLIPPIDVYYINSDLKYCVQHKHSAGELQHTHTNICRCRSRPNGNDG